MRWLLRLFLPALLATAACAAPTGRIAVSANGRFLQQQDGSPFFWLADTAWNLFLRLDREQTGRYLEDRRRKGFNVILADLLHGSASATVAGIPALIGRNPGTPNLAPSPNYWDHVDWVVDRAAEKGIYIGLVTAWGSVVKSKDLNTGNAAAYATFLARRYKSRPNLFWILGGDILGDVFPEVWRIMGRTLRAEDPNHLITFHPFGRTQSATWFHNEPWLDFNMFQSGHRRYDQDTASGHMYGEDNWRYVRDSYAKQPVKPVVDGEPSYENIPQGLHDGKQPYWGAADVRRYAWWSVFAGSFGHTYGDNAVMQFHRPTDRTGAFAPRNYWYEAIDDPGAAQMQHLKNLMLSRSFFDRVPDQTLLASANGPRYDYIAATRGRDYLFAYTYTGKPFEIRMGAISGAGVRAWWYDPRTGEAQEIGAFPNRGVRKFTAPSSQDWVLVLDDAAKRFPPPGK